MSWLGSAGRARTDRDPSVIPGPDRGPDAAPALVPGLLPGIPRQRAPRTVRAREPEPAAVPVPPRRRAGRLLPTPLGTPFTFGYALLLVATSLFAEYADPALVSDLLQGSSTDVAHLAQAPLLVLVASALWIAGGMTSAYALGFLFVLTALERRIGPLRTAAVFFGGHVLATLATELPVAFSVAAGRLPESSLHRLDYGISFGVMTSVGALAGLLPGWLRWPLLAGVGYLAVTDLLAYADPMTEWGHLLSLALGVASWPLLRRWRTALARPAPLLGDLGHPALRGMRTY
ncbi:rhomboid-like protein [Streptomyces angustmyceticus]|uniref:rhomboid-like protein n=1 Tax=Streptomyces angustmyceticus TaxID=285578 RepID=UPI0021AEEDFB|nr:rhomboid-like protein [Streptomyces angustmyceticus]